ncbi:FAD-binding and (Fe-S)-binding domain-containing protein [Williamsia sp. 1135]|uniref:FAD-binding and (Fe-S)-binding domain-containing protein n=1 Tax=Williamsia sp. 1135 TaxID=1889262 RepID=UPI000A105AE2|nr:FAD-binding and (Fe-S)-binding domain-containing protein [Williamsia sp. 1135]ORM37875.1 FAD-binding oxidoreductase [Williamsia sp. 1135]
MDPAPNGTRISADLQALGLSADTSTRRLTEYSYDASNYRLSPLVVVFPRTDEDVAAVAAYCHRNGLTVTARGGGTGMGGNAIGNGVVLDFSRHMDKVLEIDAEGRTAVAQSGIVLTTLQREVRGATGGTLTFAPDPSSQSRATLGGAIGNDACGNHSVRYGRTTDHIESLDLVTAEGLRLTALRDGLVATDPADGAAAARAEELTAAMRRLTSANMGALRTEMEQIPRQVSGYHLGKLLPENGFDVARALVGTEGTCAIVVSAKVRLVTAPTRALLLCLGYRNVVDAARDVPTLLEFAPSAIEGIDERIVQTMRARRGDDSVAGLPEGNAWLYIDLDEESAEDPALAAAQLLEKLYANGRLVDGRTVPDPAQRISLWRVREDGAGLSSRLVSSEEVNPEDGGHGGTYESWPGWEDSAVAPENLADYLEGFTELLDHHGLTGVMYGHFGAGCMHVRITFDLRSAEGRAVMRRFCTDAAALVVKHGGSLSGEHGDGRARSELLPIMYSPQMISAFGDFKKIWDPAGILNPGSIVDPDPLDENLVLADVPNRQWQTSFDLGTPGIGVNGQPGLDPFIHAVQGCIGVGRCRSDAGGVMCPSYRATRDEKDSTRGRARVLQEMVRTARDIKSGWRDEDSREALDLCLSCKACSTDCPVGVDMATYKSEFFSNYYRGRVRPLSHYSLGWMPAWLSVAGTLAPLINKTLSSRLSTLAAKAGGIDPRRTMPAFARRKQVRAGMAGLRADPSADTVLFVDSFTKAFRPHVAAATANVLGSAGRTVSCEADQCCGLTWISTGQLGHARKVLARTAAALDDGTDRPIVVPEPSCAAALRKDLPELVHTDAARRVAARVRSFAVEVGHLLDDGWEPPVPLPAEVTVQTHCHEYASFGPTTQPAVLKRLGATTVHQADGCCGVAGNFGFEKGHYDVSMDVSEQALAPALRKHGSDTPVLTDGFSCAMAVQHLTATDNTIPDVQSVHLAELLDPALLISQTTAQTPAAQVAEQGGSI